MIVIFACFSVTTKHMKWIPVGNQAQIVSIHRIRYETATVELQWLEHLFNHENMSRQGLF